MRYFSRSEAEKKGMLSAIGVASVDELFLQIPKKHYLKGLLNIPPALSETELLNLLQKQSSQNASTDQTISFLGGGAYDHWIPLLIDDLAGRSEFATCYTPYQPEVSQGTLQAIFEFQSMIADLTGMEIVNASMYDGATAAAEAALMSLRILSKGRGKTILMSRTLHPEYRQICETYLSPLDVNIIEIPWDSNGKSDIGFLSHQMEELGEELCSVIIQTPNFFGVVEETEKIANLCRQNGSYCIVAVAEAISLGLLPSPGSLGADIVVGEAQSFGNPLQFGGPYVGFFSARAKDLRQLPGRLVGATRDTAGSRAFTLTLATREQHIRREKATSNICTNQGLCALRTTLYLAIVGKSGLHQVAYQNFAKTEYAKSKLSEIHGASLQFSGRTFNEFVIQLPIPAEEYCAEMTKSNLLAGIPLSRFFPELDQSVLFCCTEMTTKEQIDRWAALSNEVTG
ncbi:MAG: aminomethyl-transferring glycine dehydrogenase subunit GcvPA [Deltaproteobacteria bacterium]|nr:aminomethyl-transferring glycine dehydrogenase subunit GcvPA [Deltaproteobacteria bacterium]